MTPFDDFAYLINHILMGEEPTIEDFILLVGTLVAFVAFILWCCFPIQAKDNNSARPIPSCRTSQMHLTSPSQSQNSYGKNCTSGMSYNYGLKNGHSYHCCT